MRRLGFAVLMAGTVIGGECLRADDIAKVAPAYAPVADSASSTALRFRKVTASGMEAAMNAQVYVVSQGRTRVKRSLGQGGTAQVGRVAPGVYSVVASGQDGWAAFGAYLGDGGVDVTNVGLIPPVDLPIVWQLFAHARQDAQLNPAPAVGAALPPGPNIAGQDGVLEILENGTVRGVLAAASAEGQPTVSLPGMTVTLIQNGQALPSVTSDENGNFELNAITEGVYSLVVSGPQGFSGVSIKAERTNEPTPVEPMVQRAASRYTFVAARAASKVTITPVPFTDLGSNPPPPQPSAETQASPSMSNLGSGGSGASGAGGGAGGGGGLLGILSGVAAGVGAAAILEDNNDGPSTPAMP